MKPTKYKNTIDAIVNIPGSKSITHRALIAAGLAKGKSTLKSFLACDDTLFTANTLRKLGIDMDINDDIVHLYGNGGVFNPVSDKLEIDLGNSGTSYRLLLSVAALAEGQYIFTGIERMKERPIGYLAEALKKLGVDINYLEKKGFPPVLINASGIKGGRVIIPGDISSQYISSLLLSGPYTKSDLTIEVAGELVSKPYIDLTLDVMKSFGVSVEHNNYQNFKIQSGQRYMSQEFIIDGDASSASYFWGAAAITGGVVKTVNIHPFKNKQGDIGLLDILEKMGCKIKREEKSVTVSGGSLTGVSVDMGSMPDVVPTLSVIALFADGKTTISNVSHLRHKESDRIADTSNEIRRIGGRVEELDDGLVIFGGDNLSGAEIDPHDDHRLAMSFAMAGLKISDIVIKDKSCVNKSFPTFWNLWGML